MVICYCGFTGVRPPGRFVQSASLLDFEFMLEGVGQLGCKMRQLIKWMGLQGAILPKPPEKVSDLLCRKGIVTGEKLQVTGIGIAFGDAI